MTSMRKFEQDISPTVVNELCRSPIFESLQRGPDFQFNVVFDSKEFQEMKTQRYIIQSTINH